MTFRPLLLGLALLAPPALAQNPPEPQFRGLEMQLQRLEQRDYNRLERERLNNQMNSIINPGQPAETLRRQMELDREKDRLMLRSYNERARVERQRTIDETNMTLRRIAPSSVLRVSQPELYGLPKLPAGKFYARLEGRFVVVDATSELVEKVLPVQPTDPTADVPAPPREAPSPPVLEAG